MEPNQTNDTAIWILVALLGVLILLGLLFAFASWLKEFQKELQYINTEINRTRGEERKHWIRQRRRLFLSIIPFIRY
ncbi:MAG: hypothetical protein IJX76_09610 [Clostridia bacterium]|nr:hypothetical protein [Clostridia bacterium]